MNCKKFHNTDARAGSKKSQSVGAHISKNNVKVVAVLLYPAVFMRDDIVPEQHSRYAYCSGFITRNSELGFECFRWQEIDMEIATYPEFQRDDFVVVAQPVLMDLTIPLKSNGKVDLTYLSADCFHISQKLNAWYASFLWESLFQPVGAKMTKLTDNPPSEKFYCPTEKRPYLATMLNSRK
ncbi:Phospholipase B1, membrane-associated [Ooceraea biroi]|uniref:Phospholipase B1, membrane-associated n=1 Tax=Ooceraea biroi TaxID=2015173 RepID=A0A026W8R3_OOCBI|nr:Phospholipase B1, membrane-associated [Ooceraea biroi]